MAWLNPFDRQAATDVGLQVDFPDWVRGRGGDEGVGDEEGGLEEGDEEEELTAPTSPGEGHGIVDVSNPGVVSTPFLQFSPFFQMLSTPLLFLAFSRRGTDQSE